MARLQLRFSIIFLHSVNYVLAVCLLLGRNSLAQNQTADESKGFSFSFGPQNPFHRSNFTLLQDAYIGNALAPKQNQSANALILTPNTNFSAGRALYSQPIRIRNNKTKKLFQFQANFSFASLKSAEWSGEGIAFIMAPDNVATGLPFQYLGWLNDMTQADPYGHNFAVEFDSGLSAEFNDLDDNHVGVNVNSLNSTVSTGSGSFKDSGDTDHTSQIDLSVDNPVYAWIEYNYFLKVTISTSKMKPARPLIHMEALNLSDIFKDFVYIGFTGSTEMFDNKTENATNEVYEFSFRTLGEIEIPVQKSYIAMIIAVGVSVLLSLVLLLISLWYCRRYRKRKQERRIMTLLTELYRLPDYYGSHKLKYSDLRVATAKFSEKEKLGRGGFGWVYKGVLPGSNVAVAVKRIGKTSKQGAREFLAEVKIIGRMSHRNLVPLLGWCHHKRELLLVYEFMPNGSLDQLIFRRDGASARFLSWEQRANIVIGVAKALHFLHDEYEQRVLHRDVKASNVMLDCDWNARLGDFGLARSSDHSEGPQMTAVLAGTPGYMAPELFEDGRATEKTDVYSFGALTLEIVTGRRAAERDEGKHGDGKILVDWVWSQFASGNLLAAADAMLGEDCNDKQVELVLQMGLLCCHTYPEERPTMGQILGYLKMEIPFPVHVLPPYRPRPSSAFSRAYCSASRISNWTLTRSRIDSGTDRENGKKLEVV